MRFNGEWLHGDDGIVRPILRAEILSGNDGWHAFELLVDTGADRTVISANVLEAVNLPTIQPLAQIAGVGGAVRSVLVETQIRWLRDDGNLVTFRGQYSACLDYESLDMSVLGRDILDMFTLIVDRRSKVLAILGGQHHYTIVQQSSS